MSKVSRCYLHLSLCLLMVAFAWGFRWPNSRAKGAGDEDDEDGVSHHNTTATDETTRAIDDKYTALVDWMCSNGGRVDERMGMGKNVEDGAGRGAVALNDIEAGTELLFCPWSLVLGTVGDTSKVPTEHCDVLNAYADQVRAGKDSFWYPYLSMDDSIDTRIPTIWEASALAELQGLLPDTAQSGSLADWFSDNCSNGTPFDQLDHAARQSLQAAITRSAGMRFLPIFDLMNHHNGKLNTRSNASAEGNSVFAAVDIPKGSEIFNSYKGGLATSSDIFRRYGFIESWPQQWAWADAAMAQEDQRFLLLPDNVVAIYPPGSMTQHIGTAAPPLATLQADAKRHNQQLDASKLAEFCDSARRLLQSLPSTAEEDGVILEQLLAAHQSDPGDSLLLGDKVSAIAYRRCFKEAVQTALAVATTALTKEYQDNPSSEL